MISGVTQVGDVLDNGIVHAGKFSLMGSITLVIHLSALEHTPSLLLLYFFRI